MLRSGKWPFAASLLLALVVWAAVYRETLSAIVDLWRTNSTFSHGILIVPIALWLAWGKRSELGAIPWEPSWVGAAAVLACAAAWVVGRGVGVVGLEQFAVVASIPALTLAVLGSQAARVLVFPLSFLMFAVPIGHALVPVLMSVTADVATWLLQATGVPVLRAGMYISIPAGQFEVARACSGLNYVVTGLVLGVLYTYLTFSSWPKRLVSLLAFIVIPIVANGLRVYVTILVSHLTDMRFGPGAEHVWFGRVFFIVVMLAMFMVARRWSDPIAAVTPGHAMPQPTLGLGSWAAVAGAMLAILAGPLYLAYVTERVESRLAVETEQLQLPSGLDGWQGPQDEQDAWRPLYSGARLERIGTYQDSDGATVDVYLGVYGIGTVGGAEMISYGNRISREDHRSLNGRAVRRVALPGGGQLLVREQLVSDGRLVWFWFMVGDQSFTSPYAVKAQEAMALVAGGTVTERIVTLATEDDVGASQRLARFVAAHADCVNAGFSFESCGR